MPRNANRFGGGARTNQNGLYFEQTTSLNDALIRAGYDVENYMVYRGNLEIGMSVPQKHLYTNFLNPRGISYSDYNSKEWRPDEPLSILKIELHISSKRNFKIVTARLMKNFQVVILVV